MHNNHPKHLLLDKESDPSVTRFPSPVANVPSDLNEEDKIAYIAQRFREIMEALGLDLEDDSLRKTPYRVAKMYVSEIFSGLNPETFPEISFMEDKFHIAGKPNLVFVKIHFTSFCEHHFVPFMGHAWVAYLPNGKLIGLSKIPRIVKFFAKRPQIQERLTAQIADSLAILLETEDVAVTVTAQHFCVLARGIEDQNGCTTTSVLRGKFETEEAVRQQYYQALREG